jgi:hypothetical protein
MAIKDNDVLLARMLKERVAAIAPPVGFRVFGSP